MDELETRDRLTAVHIYERAFPRPAIGHLNALANAHGGRALPLDREQEEGLYRLLLRIAERTWWSLSHEDHLEAFAAHPKIGEKKVPSSGDAKWSTGEQAGAAAANEQTLAELADSHVRPADLEAIAVGLEAVHGPDAKSAVEGMEAEIAEKGGGDERHPQAVDGRATALAGDHHGPSRRLEPRECPNRLNGGFRQAAW